MGFDLFGPARTSDIRVGYISTDRGYVQGASICEANSYAQLNPGTTFIIKNREAIEYKNINEVNRLRPQDVFIPAPGGGMPLPPDSPDRCAGIQPLRECGPVRAEFYGGAGVGARGNPVIGNDGSVMAIHMVSRGHGYQYPPLVKILDDCNNRGAGAVARVLGIGQTAITTEVYSAEEEFEEYYPEGVRGICNVETARNNVGHGRRYDPSGNDIGSWNPAMYVADEEDPILRQISLFQEYLAALTDPWWFSRKEDPLRVTCDNEDQLVQRRRRLNINPNRSVYPVQHWAWGGSQVRNAPQVGIATAGGLLDETFEVYTAGGSGRGLQFTFTEVGGDHVFVVRADDYTDGGVARALRKGVKPNVDYTVTSVGSHRGRDAATGTEQGLLRDNFGNRGTKKGLGTSNSIFADLLGTNNDADDLQILAREGQFRSTSTQTRRGRESYNLIYKLTAPLNDNTDHGALDSNIESSFMNDHAISPVPMSNIAGSDFAGMLFTMEWEEEFPYPGEYTFKAQCDNVASFYLDGQQEIGEIAKWRDSPTILKKNLTWEDDDKHGKVFRMRLDLLNALEYRDVILQAPPPPPALPPVPSTPTSRGVDIQYTGLQIPGNRRWSSATRLEFDDNSANGFDVNGWFTIDSGDATFSSDGLRIEGRGEVRLTYAWNDRPSMSGKVLESITILNTTWTQSNRRRGSETHTINLTDSPPSSNAVTATFEATTRDNIELVVSGNGTAEIEIILDTDDNPRISGLALTAMRCGDISLTRTRNRRRETLRGTGTFAAGRHRVEIIGTTARAGYPRVSDTRIELLDRHGSDANATLTLRVTSTSVTARPQPPARPPTRPQPTIPGLRVTKVFDTVTWMTRANRPLWRTNVSSRGGFINTFGICPFDTSLNLEDNPYAGTHEIEWRNINFPIDGNYTIKAAVDDSVTLRFRGPGGDVEIRKEGFSTRGDATTHTGTSTYTRFFRRGTYILNARLEQIPGGRFSFTRSRDGLPVRNQEVGFRVTSASGFANRITIPGLFQVEKEHDGPQISENLMRMVEVGREYDVILTSAQTRRRRATTTFGSNNVRVRLRDGGRRLQMEDWTDNDWRDIECTITDGEFYQVSGNRCKFRINNNVRGINPMALAVDVEVAYATRTEVSARSWNENPMGVAFTIKAPIPPVPQEDRPKQKGRCPNNPMWTTRFPADTQWYPVRRDFLDPVTGKRRKWSDFLNRWAISPALPLSTPGTDEGGKVFTNTWNVDIPYDGFYQLKGEVDDIARYYIDDDLKLDLSRRKSKIRGSSKFRLTAGLKKVRVEVENYTTITYANVDRKIFSARDWRRRPPTLPPPPATGGGIVCHAGGGRGGTDNSAQLQGGRVIVGQGGQGGQGGDDNWADRHHGGKGGGAGLRSGGSADHGLTHSQIDAMDSSRRRGGPGGFGVNFAGSSVGTIQQVNGGGSGGNGVAMGGGGGGSCGGGASGSGGNGGVKITWGLTGRSQEWTTPGIHYVNVPGNILSQTTTSSTPVTARFEGTGLDNIELVVSGTGTAQCTIVLDTNDSWTSRGVALTALRIGDISLTRTSGERNETLTGTGTFVGGQRYPVQIIGADSRARQPRIASTRLELLDNHRDDTNASVNLTVASAPQLDGVTIVCIGGGGSGFMDDDGDRQGSGGAGGGYAWANRRDIESGRRLKIVVGAGGAGRSTRGGESGGDSYVEIVSVPPPTNVVQQTRQLGEVTYEGPYLFHFVDRRWGRVMNRFGVSPADREAFNLDAPSPNNVGRKTLEWTNVDFPLRGQYDVLFAADNKAKLYINGQEMLFANENYSLASTKSTEGINISQPGKYTIKIELDNTYHDGASTRTHAGDDVFRSNPTGVVLEIKKAVRVATDVGKSWDENPMGVSGILIPPPCPKEIGGKGLVPDPIIDDPGNGYVKPPKDPDEIEYPVITRLKDVIPDPPGINYNCAVDKITMVPDLGYKLQPVCGPFGEIIDVTIAPPDPSVDDGTGTGTPPPTLTRTPEISISSSTGVNCRLKPVLEVIPVPPDVLPPDQILQVTDLAGIKKTGYYNGKPYYGAVFYENGIKYAGWYATAGQPIQIYDTMQESIDATVTTPPSAIQRQGSDVTSNDPRLNIPGTPENLT